MRVLLGGDVVGSRGCAFAVRAVRSLRDRVDVVILNGENSADGNGITRSSAESLYTVCDVITTGNHAFRRREFTEQYDDLSYVLRPANYPEGTPGRGVCLIDKGSYRLAVMNICGTAFMDDLDNPFECAERLLTGIDTKNIILDFHAEATSEKKAMGFFLDGKVSAVMGTHTHVQTADEIILPHGTAYISDVGMCGTELSVLGVEASLAVRKQRYKLPVRFEEAAGEQIFCGAIVTIDERSGRAAEISRVQIREKDLK
ncbi:MAG: YmdB family metallophosphoesterase [Oscillospiraceae bacterium]|nr:YmdB family metallophosphoesterase [Oscillospiraceae bacterium]MBQ8979432.1 YmdB family metallophosphoesterase [Oscillospiraceae bacterium]